MADIERSGEAFWQGDSRSGKGQITTPSGVLKNDPYTYATRFENANGTNPEELIAAAQAACLSMAFASALTKNGHKPESVHVNATVLMNKQEIGFTVTGMRLDIEGRVPGIDEQTFKRIAEEAEKGCPISRLLRPGLQNNVELVAKLLK